jgi:hypothetical protein
MPIKPTPTIPILTIAENPVFSSVFRMSGVRTSRTSPTKRTDFTPFFAPFFASGSVVHLHGLARRPVISRCSINPVQATPGAALEFWKGERPMDSFAYSDDPDF